MKYNSIQIYRGLLFLGVLCFHCGVPFFSFGWAGVETFFVLSSFFIVKKLYPSDTVKWREQSVRRIQRLYPPYLAVLLVGALFALAKRMIPYDLITHLCSVQNIHWMITGYQSPMQSMTAHTWTLSIEVILGLTWFFILKVAKKRTFVISMVCMLIAGITYRTVTILCGCSAFTVSLCPLAHADAFAAGSLLAVCFVEKRLKKPGLIGIGIAGIAGCVFCIVRMSDLHGCGMAEAYELLASSKNYLNDAVTGNIYVFISMVSVSVIGLLILAGSPEWIDKNPVCAALTKMGNESYALYLFHWPVYVVISRFTSNWCIVLIGTFALSVAADLVFVFASNWMKKHKRRKPA